MSVSTYSNYSSFGAVRWLAGGSGLYSGTRAQTFGLAIGPNGRIVYDVVDLSQAARDFIGNMSGGISDAAAVHSALSNATTHPSSKFDGKWQEPEFPGPISSPFTPVDPERQDNSLIYFVGKNYSKESLRGVNFDGAVVSGSDFSRSDLTGADFSYGKVDGANFSAADLGGARFDYTDVTGANFLGADLRGADLSKAIGLTATQVSAAMMDTTTLLPEELSYLNVSAPPVGVSYTFTPDLTTEQLQDLYTSLYA